MAETSFVRGRAARFTRLNELGRPVYGPGNMAVTKGIVTVTLTPNTQEGEAISLPNFAGEECVADPAPCGSITNWTVNIEFCAVDPCIVGIMYPSWPLYYDDFGNPKGYTTRGQLVCDEGFALEIWGGVGNTSGSGVQCGPAASGGFQYLLLPRLIGAVPGEVTIANDAVTFTFAGTTSGPVGWRRGPYLVDIVGGVPSVLREPIVTDGQIFRMTTNVRPPQPTDGCVNLPRPIPEPATVIFDADPANDTGMCVRAIIDNNGYGPVTVDWGDGTEVETHPDCSVATHCYTTPGTYTVCVADQQTPVVTVCRDIVVPITGDAPILSVSGDPDDASGMCVIATVDMPPHSDGRVSVDWGDDSEPSTATVTPGTPAEMRHCYTTPSIYQVTATRVELPQYRADETILVPVQENPTISAAVAGNVVTLTVDNHGNGLTTVDWGDGTSGPGPSTDGGTVTHTYAEAGTYTITVRSNANPIAMDTVTVTVGGGTPITATVSADPSDPTGYTAVVNWNNGGGGGEPTANVEADPSDPTGFTAVVSWDAS